MNTKLRSILLFSTLLLACDSDAQDAELRSDSHWAAVVCTSGCYGLVPEAATSDLWAPLIPTTDLRELLDAGLLVGATGYGGCAGLDAPKLFPWSACFASTGNGPLVVYCYGGDASWVTPLHHVCEVEPGFAAANTDDYATGSCTSLPQILDLPGLDWVHASSYQPNVARAGAGVDTFHVHPGCAL